MQRRNCGGDPVRLHEIAARCRAQAETASHYDCVTWTKRNRRRSQRGEKIDFADAQPIPIHATRQYFAEIGSSSAGKSVITRQPLSVTTTSSSMRAAE